MPLRRLYTSTPNLCISHAIQAPIYPNLNLHIGALLHIDPDDKSSLSAVVRNGRWLTEEELDDRAASLGIARPSATTTVSDRDYSFLHDSVRFWKAT